MNLSDCWRFCGACPIVSKLSCYGLCDQLITWIKNFLIGRTQYVKIMEKLLNASDIYNRLSVNGLWSSGRWKVVKDYHEALRKLKYCVVPYSKLKHVVYRKVMIKIMRTSFEEHWLHEAELKPTQHSTLVYLEQRHTTLCSEKNTHSHFLSYLHDG